jgi:GT2 family glycosyltransferase
MDRAPVLAVVVTHNARHSLEQCLDALAKQSVLPQTTLVVDNGSVPPIDDVIGAFPGVQLIEQDNQGPAGGHATGLEAFLDSPASEAWAWVMDDDCVAEPDALAALLRRADADPDAGVVFPRVVSASDGARHAGVGWWGFLVHRRVVERVGVPIRELFWWAEDTEYLHWRIPREGILTANALDAVVRVRT